MNELARQHTRRRAGLALVAALVIIALSLSDLYGFWRRLQTERLLTWGDRAALGVAETGLAAASAWRPLDADLVVLKARLHEQRADREPLASTAERAHLAQARAAMAHAASLRPTRPLDALTSLRLLARSGELGEGFHEAFLRTLRLGRWERSVELGLLEIGLAVWPLLAPSDRQLVESLARTALLSQHRELIPIGVRLGREAELREWIGDDPTLLSNLEAQLRRRETQSGRGP